MSPTNEQECCHCGVAIKSELRWKIPLIIGLFLAAITLSIILQLATN
ncbi:MAG: hypothetical protein P1U86_01480 [Verrucomicrobiales bacterium]|nr:hypothetical protein [Verrucomicrobiales bacterium]